MVVGVSVNSNNPSTRMADFLRGYDYILLLIMCRTEERHILPSVCVSACQCAAWINNSI